MPLAGGQMGRYRQGPGPPHLLRPAAFLAFLQAAHHKIRVGLAALAHNNGNTEPLGALLMIKFTGKLAREWAGHLPSRFPSLSHWQVQVQVTVTNSRPGDKNLRERA